MAERETFRVWDDTDEMWAMEGEEFSSRSDAQEALLEIALDENWSEEDCEDGFTIYKQVGKAKLSRPEPKIVDVK